MKISQLFPSATFAVIRLLSLNLILNVCFFYSTDPADNLGRIDQIYTPFATKSVLVADFTTGVETGLTNIKGNCSPSQHVILSEMTVL